MSPFKNFIFNGKPDLLSPPWAPVTCLPNELFCNDPSFKSHHWSTKVLIGDMVFLVLLDLISLLLFQETVFPIFPWICSSWLYPFHWCLHTRVTFCWSLLPFQGSSSSISKVPFSFFTTISASWEWLWNIYH